MKRPSDASPDCATCSDLATDLLRIMTEHLRAESDLAEAMFVAKDPVLAHKANQLCVSLLLRRDEQIAALKFHCELCHDDDDNRVLGFALP